MTQQVNVDSVAGEGKRRGRGPAKPYPIIPFEEAMVLAKTIVEEGVGDQMRRLTLFDRINKSAESGASRQLISISNRYGLTSGGYQAEYLTVTADGKEVTRHPLLSSGFREKAFALSITQFDVFRQVYEKLKQRRLPAEDVLYDEFGKFGFNAADQRRAADVFVANARHVGIVKTLSGNETLISIEQVLEETEDAGEEIGNRRPDLPTIEDQDEQPIAEQHTATRSRQPSVHIDVQIHIDANASSEQIDQIFASMARHLYGREG